jgi:hypothetical protein
LITLQRRVADAGAVVPVPAGSGALLGRMERHLALLNAWRQRLLDELRDFP